MHAFVIVSLSRITREETVARLLAPYSIAPVDVTRIAPGVSIGIEIVREIKKRVALKPFQSKQKAIVIEEAQLLTGQAQNALLKTLEEPPDHTIIILLVSTNIYALLPTVISRCQVIEISASGSWQLAPSELEATSKKLEAILEGGLGERLKLAQEVTKDRTSAIQWLANIILATRRDLLEKIRSAIQPANKKSNATEDILVYLQLLRLFQKGHTLLATTNVNPRFTLEILFLSISATIKL